MTMVAEREQQLQVAAPEYVSQGRHLMLTMSGCPSELLDNEEFLKRMAFRAVAATGATVLQVTSHHFDPQGVTILVLLSESHASIHTYPESGVIFWDCFTCGWTCQPERSIDVLVDALKPAAMRWNCVTRGDWLDSDHIEGNGG
jgi:S-adenosylmethionine decarboxylase